MRTGIVLAAALAALGCAERGTCVRGEKGFDVSSPVRAPGRAPPTACATLFYPAAQKPTGLTEAAVQGLDPAAVAVVKFGALAALHVAKSVPFVGDVAAQAVGKSLAIGADGSILAKDLAPGRYRLEVACAEGWAAADWKVPDPPPALRLSAGAEVTLSATKGEPPFDFLLFKEHALRIAREKVPVSSVHVTGLPPGRYLVGFATKAGMGAAELELKPGDNGTVSLAPLEAPQAPAAP
jgi:hypothetical protein